MEGYSGDAELESVSSVVTDMGSMFANTGAMMTGTLKQASQFLSSIKQPFIATKINTTFGCQAGNRGDSKSSGQKGTQQLKVQRRLRNCTKHLLLCGRLIVVLIFRSVIDDSIMG